MQSTLADTLPPLLLAKELAELLRTTPDLLAHQRHRGVGVPFIKQGARVLYRREDVLAYLDANTYTQTKTSGAA